LAAQRAVHRAAEEADRARDAYERDDGLQRRTSGVYEELAAANWGGPWAVVPPDVNAGELADRLLPG
jgi:dTMP kinase